MNKPLPNPNVGDQIEVILVANPEHRKVAKGTIIHKTELTKETPVFNSYRVRIGKKIYNVSYNPMIQGFYVPDYTD